MTSSQNIDDQPRVQQTNSRETSHAYPRIVRKYQQTGYNCNEMPKIHPILKQRNLSPSAEVKMNIVVENVQGNRLPITQNDIEKTANQKSLMGGKT